MKNEVELNHYGLKTKIISLQYVFKNLKQKPLLLTSSTILFFILLLFFENRLPLIVSNEKLLLISRFSLCLIFFSAYLMILIKFSCCKDKENFLLTFSKIGLVDHLGLSPYPLYYKENKEGTQTLILYAPGFLRTDFEKYKENIENSLNKNILNIEQDPKQKDTFILRLCDVKPLPTNVFYEKEKYCSKSDASVFLGQTQNGLVELDFNKTPHGIICGSTGGGKSVLSKVILTQAKANGADVFVVDPKMSDDFKEFKVFYTLEEALNLTDSILFEISSRQKSLDKNFKRIIVLIDEASFLMDTTGLLKDEKEQTNRLIRNLTDIARIGRAFKVNLIFTTQRSDSTHSLPGNLKCNCSLRLSAHLPDRASSEVIMGDSSAYNLPNIPGRFVISDGTKTTIFQAFNIR